MMPRSNVPLSPEELVAKTGYENSGQRLAAFDAADPSRQRPRKCPASGIGWPSWSGRRGATWA